MRRTLLAGLLAVLAAGPSPAARQLTLREALTLAREHSFEIRRALAEEQAAGEALGAARAARLPTLDASAIAFYNTEVASLDLATSLGRLSREIGTKENVQTDLRLAFPLYTGGRIAGGVDAAQASARRQAALTEAAVDDLLYRTRVAYLTVHRSDRQIEAARSALRRAQITRAQVASLLSAGAADSVAVLEAQLAVSETELRLQQALHDRREAVIQFAQLVGLSASDSLDLATPLAPPAAPGDPDTGFVRPELAAAQAAVEIGRAGVARAAADWFPTLAAFGGYSYGKPNLDRFGNTWNDYWQVGARLDWSFNLGRGTRREVNRAKFTVSAAENQRNRLAEQLREQHLLAWERLRLAYEQYLTALDRAALTRRNYELATSRHSEGVLSSNRLMEIEATLNEAEAGLAAAEAGYYIARSAYLYASGADLMTEGF